jgi:hypothetical protein
MQTSTRVLITLFSRYSKSRPVTRSQLARSLGLSTVELERVLAELERAECVDAARLRLTLRGLAVAVACAAEASSRPRRRPSARRTLVRSDLAA